MSTNWLNCLKTVRINFCFEELMAHGVATMSLTFAACLWPHHAGNNYTGNVGLKDGLHLYVEHSNEGAWACCAILHLQSTVLRCLPSEIDVLSGALIQTDRSLINGLLVQSGILVFRSTR